MVDVEDCALPGHQLVLKSYDRLGRALRLRRLRGPRESHDLLNLVVQRLSVLSKA